MKKYSVVMVFTAVILLTLGITATALAGVPNFFNVKDYGAIGNGETLDTPAINKAIEDCAASGGGTVYFPPGTYLSGSIHLRSNVTLYLDSGATILGSKRYGENSLLLDFDPYENIPFKLYQDPSHSYFHHSLIWGENIHNIAIVGNGIIDLNGAWEIPTEIQENITELSRKGMAYGEVAEKLGISDEILHYLLTYGVRGPKPIALKECQNILIRDITIKNGTDIGILLTGCDDVNINGVTIETYIDGINLDGCHNATISGCRIKSGDDAIALKSSYALNRIRSCENIVIDNCVLRSQCLGIKMGTESNGGYKNISITNCVIYDTLLGGLALEIVDGGILENVVISDIVMENVEAPIFIRLGNRARGPDSPPVGKIRNVSISNVMATVDEPPLLYPELGNLPEQAWLLGYYHIVPPMVSSITGIPGHPVEDISLNNITIIHRGGGTKEQAAVIVPERPEAYPNPDIYGTLPAYGLYCRHVDGLKLRNVRLGFFEPDMRPALICDTVENLELDAFSAEGAAGGEPTIVLKQVKRAFIHGCKSSADTTFLRVEGAETEKIILIGNELSEAKQPLVEIGEDVPEGSVILRGQ